MKSVTLKRLSICKCGFHTLDESIKLGTIYTIDEISVRGGFSYFCGGCKRTMYNVEVVKASQVLHPERPMMWLPYDLVKGSNLNG